MKVYFTQMYMEAGVAYPFSWIFQKYLSASISSLVVSSDKFVKTYGEEWCVSFYISASKNRTENFIGKPVKHRKDKEVDFFISLPFKENKELKSSLRHAFEHIICGVCDTLCGLDIDVSAIKNQKALMLEEVLSNAEMLERS